MRSAGNRAASRARRRLLALLALMLVGCPGPVPAADEPVPGRSALSTAFDRTSLGGSLRGAYWSSSRDLDDRKDLLVAALWLHGRWDPVPSVSLSLDGWVRNDDLFHEDDVTTKLREGYLNLRFGPLDLRLGKQIIAWGRADRINPTNNLTPRDFTLLVPEDDDQRFGTTGIRATYYAQGMSLTGVVLPTFEPDIIPIRRPPPPATLGERVPVDPVLQGALKLDRTGGRVDWSLSYFDGYDLFPDVQLADPGSSGNLFLTYHRIRVIGADAAAALGPYTVRGEAAYTFTEHSRSGDQIKSPFFFLVLGVDRTLPGGVYANLQYVLRVVSEFQSATDIADPVRRAVAIEQALINDQMDQVSQSVAIRIGKSWLNETLVGEINSIVSLTRFGYALRPKITYALTDHVKVTGGVDLFGGQTPSLFSRLRDASTAYLEVRWDF